MSEFWIIAGFSSTILFIVVAMVFLFGEPLKLRVKMFGRQRSGFGVMEVIHRNGRRIPYAVKFGPEIKIGDKWIFKPKYDQEHIFRNEFNMPTIQFNVKSVEPISLDSIKEPIVVGEEHQVSPNKAPQSVITDPIQDMQSHMAFFQAGLLKGQSMGERFQQLLYICMVASIACIGMIGFLMYKLDIFG